LRDGLPLSDLPLVGVFALNSPSRPNPIGLTQVKVLQRRGRRIDVKGLDFFDGTPVLDIKPYHPDYRVLKTTVPGWNSKLERRAKSLRGKRVKI
jgi:tRNA (Thr-GGU) A37 N-methylase